MKIDLTEEQLHFLIRAVIQSYTEDTTDHVSADLTDQGVWGEVIGILTQAGDRSHKIYNQARQSRCLETPIRKSLFMGSGWYSTINANNLHKRLQFAVCELGSMQQNGGMGTEYLEQEDIDAKKNIKDVILDIMIAFDMKLEDLK